MGAASSPLSASALSQRFTDVKSLVPERKIFLLAARLSSKIFLSEPFEDCDWTGVSPAFAPSHFKLLEKS